MNKEKTWKKFNITMLIITGILTLGFILFFLQFSVVKNPHYKSPILTTIGDNKIFKEDITRIEVSHKDMDTIVIEDKDDIATICNWINPISGYRINSVYALVTNSVYTIKFYSNSSNILRVSISPGDFRIAGKTPRKRKFYSLGANYYDEFTELLNSLGK
ncbi:MAG: hypothetical protein IKL08_02255 [Clostridia bacterium]|nr:hypothetical protein [Clostridia bacterium]